MVRLTWRVVVVLLPLALAATACDRSAAQVTTTTMALPTDSATRAATAFLEAWERHDWSALPSLVADPSSMPDVNHRTAWGALGVNDTAISIGTIHEIQDTATVDFTVTAQLTDLGAWTYDGKLTAAALDGEWKVSWFPSTLHPALIGARKLSRSSVWATRASILAWDGTPLVIDREVVEIGVEPQRITDRAVLLDALTTVLELEADRVDASIDAPGVQPDWFVPVATVRPDRFEELDPLLRPVPGVVFRRSTTRLAPTDEFARHVLGRTGEITAELLQAWGDPYAVGDTVGLSGLERVFEERLAGTPSGEVRVLDAGGGLIQVLQRFEGAAPEPVQTTFDATLQIAADQALSGVEHPAALVVIDAATGELRAVASRPFGEFNRALAGRYPPGSTFKVITAAALLTAGMTPDDAVSCPRETVVGGRSFTNSNDIGLGTVSLQTAFAQSCNTAFASLAAGLDASALRDAADAFGFDVPYGLGLDTAGGIYPAPLDIVDQAAGGIGQGRVTTSPLHMASVAAAVADGGWQPPILILEPLADVPGQQKPLDPETSLGLASMMRAAVDMGTGTEAAVPGPPVAGKTGSAEFGEDDPPKSHAWFIGFREDIAFAVLVEGGGSGGVVAGPIAAAFLGALG